MLARGHVHVLPNCSVSYIPVAEKSISYLIYSFTPNSSQQKMLRIESPLNYLKQAPMDSIDSWIELFSSLMATKYRPPDQT